MGLRFCGIVLLEPRPWRERLVDFADLGLHHQLHVHRELAERAADEPEEAADLGDRVADRVPGDRRLGEAELVHQARPASPSRLARSKRACRQRRRIRRSARAAAAARAARDGARSPTRSVGHLVAERDRHRLLEVAARRPSACRGSACARSASAAEMAPRSSSTSASASRICSTVAVSVMSCVVAPQWHYSPSLSRHNAFSCDTTPSTG